MEGIEHYCEIPGCNRVADRMHLVTQATLPKKHRWDPVFWLYGCRQHHSEEHTVGTETWCKKYGFVERLAAARQARALLNGERE